MITQILNISFPQTYVYCLNKYGLKREEERFYPYAFEIRKVPRNIIRGTLPEKVYLSSKNSELCDLLWNMDIGDSLHIFDSLFSNIDEIERNKYFQVVKNFIDYDNKIIKVGDKAFNLSGVYVMGILNVTPDSFSDGGKYFNPDSAFLRAEEMILNGADIIDIGGESTRPGSEPVSAAEEIKRTVPVIERIIAKYPEAIISIDTTKSETAGAAMESGARIVNDVSGGTFDPEILVTAKKYGAAVILMHIKGVPKSMQQNISYDDVTSEVYDFLFTRTEAAREKGIENIIIDPGIGFGKTTSNNLELIKRLEEFKSIAPILIGVSRKSFLGKILNLGIDERDFPTAIAESVAIRNGARFIRTHNVSNGVILKKLLNYINNPQSAINYV